MSVRLEYRVYDGWRWWIYQTRTWAVVRWQESHRESRKFEVRAVSEWRAGIKPSEDPDGS